MSTQFDTCGVVTIAAPGTARYGDGCVQWSDLDPFTQGYVEALAESFGLQYWHDGESDDTPCLMAFSDLAPVES